MVRNEETFTQVLNLRKQGFTLSEIGKMCGISKSTASLWLKDQAFSGMVSKQNQRRAAEENGKRLRLMAKSRGSEVKRRYADARASAKTEFENYKRMPEFQRGLMTFICNGNDGVEHKILLNHPTPFVHCQFHDFAQRYLGVPAERIKVTIHAPEGILEEKILKHWRSNTKLPSEQLNVYRISRPQRKNPLHIGVGSTIIASTYHRNKLLEWVRLARKQW